MYFWMRFWLCFLFTAAVGMLVFFGKQIWSFMSAIVHLVPMCDASKSERAEGMIAFIFLVLAVLGMVKVITAWPSYYHRRNRKR